MHQPTLKHFLLRQKVLALYRRALRSSKADPATRRETITWIRSEFERNRHLTDVVTIEEQLRLGQREISQILPSTR
ncbi:hypothetical protein EDD85DRAFT_44301 [Armillaria nabsnona]|nr:hypothetical protein EDD85DRAFT_44301 [Armillaria nabsnona]